MGLQLPAFFLAEGWLWRLRLGFVSADSTSERLAVCAVVDEANSNVVGHAMFHGAPDSAGMVEIGYIVVPDLRRRGYGAAAATALLRRAAADTRVRTVRASVSPHNQASLSIIRRLGFVQVGEQWDEEDGLELVFERPADLPAPTP